jgi:hypothetical protein
VVGDENDPRHDDGPGGDPYGRRMPLLRRHSRDRYLNELAAEPLFHDVPRQLIAVVGRSVDRFELDAGALMPCDLAREALLIARGNVVLLDSCGHAVAAVGPLGMIGGRAPIYAGYRIVATAPVSGFVVGRRELPALAAAAPTVNAALLANEAGGLAGREPRPMPVSAARSAPASLRASRS